MQLDMFSNTQDPKMRSLSTRVPGMDVTIARIGDILQVATGLVSGHFDFCVNPYIGCQFSCSYCYAAEFAANEGRRQMWGYWVKVRANAARTIAKHPYGALEGKRIFFGSVTDPYQPLEQRFHVTRRILEALAKRPERYRIHIQTRSPHVVHDAELLESIVSHGSRVSVGMSIPTDSEQVRQVVEPRAPSIPARIQAISELSKKAPSVYITACVMPAMPMGNPEHFAIQLLNSGAHRINDSTLNLVPPRRDGPPRAATREMVWPLLRSVLGLPEESAHHEIVAAYMVRADQDLTRLLNTIENRPGGRS